MLTDDNSAPADEQQIVIGDKTADKPSTVPLNEEGLPVLGMHVGVEERDYRRAPGINKSMLDKIAKSPATYMFEKMHPRPGTPSMVFGSALHCLVLEPQRFEEIYIPDPYSGSQSKEAKLWREEMKAAGKTVINTKGDPTDPWDRSDWDTLRYMRDAVMANGVASALITECIAEVSFWWVDDEVHKLCKGRIDGWSPAHSIPFDLKSTSDATWNGFSRSIHEYRYDVQDAFYSDGVRASGQMIDDFVFIAVEKDPPYLCACYTLPFEWVQDGRITYKRDLETYKRCMNAGEWPGLDELRELQMPRYARYKKIS